MRSSTPTNMSRLGFVRTAVLAAAAAVFFVLFTFAGVPPASAATCVINGTPVATVASQMECDALVALYTSTDGTNWTDNTGWNTPTDPCTWYEVSCNADLSPG